MEKYNKMDVLYGDKNKNIFFYDYKSKEVKCVNDESGLYNQLIVICKEHFNRRAKA